MNIKVLVATNKEYRFPNDEMYIPIQGGRSYSEPIEAVIGDDTGDNISDKNARFCELTSLYWGWKNLDCDYMGLCHYRRHFGSRRHDRLVRDKWDKILKKDEAEELLKDVPVILTKKRVYMIESLYSHYGHTHNSIDLKITRQILEEKYKDYLYVYDVMMNKTSAHMFNMFIMRKDLVDKYCEWLFDILSEVEERLDVSEYSDYEKRVFGRISELLLDVWLIKNNIGYSEVPLVFMEKQHWVIKFFVFLKAKYFSGKEL